MGATVIVRWYRGKKMENFCTNNFSMVVVLPMRLYRVRKLIKAFRINSGLHSLN